MNYGVVLPIWQLTIADAESLTTRAEQLGLDGVFVPDHILAKPATTQHYGGHWPDPFSLLAYLAGRTQRIRLGASVIVLPYRSALVAAKAAATVDQASGGRFIFGVGVRRGRRAALGLAPRNLLNLTASPKGRSRAAFQGSVAEVASDVRRVRTLGAEWMTFDLPRAGVPAMLRAMERLAGEVKPAAA